jgi:hypothetical protein
MTRDSATGTSGLLDSSGGGIRVSWAAMVSRGEVLSKGDAPVRSSYASNPTA